MPTAATAFLPVPTTTPQGRRILVVDDDPTIRELFRAVLRRADFSVEVAESGVMALRRMAEVPPDVVTLDLAMPGMDGFTVVDRLRAMPCPPPIVVVSGAAYEEEVLSFGCPVVAFLAKPLHPADLVVACERALSRPRGPSRKEDPHDVDESH